MPPRDRPDDEVALVDRVRSGDGDAFECLVRRYMPEAIAIARRLMRQEEDAEDLVQDAFLTSLAKIDSIRPGNRFAPWFFRVLMNLGINARRSRARRTTEQIPERTAAVTPLPSTVAEASELREQIRTTLERLPERERLIVELADLQGFTSQEIGEILEIPAGTVRWELHRARNQLRAALLHLQERDHEPASTPYG